MNRWTLEVAVASWVLFSSFDQSMNAWQSAFLDMYNIAVEADFPVGSGAAVKDCSGGIIANVSNDYLGNLQNEGSGQLRNGSFVNCIDEACTCFATAACALGAAGYCLKIYQDVASRDWSFGTKLLVKEFEGFKLPSGETHNGCVQVEDKSDQVPLNWIQWYVYSQKDFNDLRMQFKGNVTIQGNSTCTLKTYIESSPQPSEGPNSLSAPSEAPSSQSDCTTCTTSRMMTKLEIGATVGGGATIIALLAMVVYIRKSSKRRARRDDPAEKFVDEQQNWKSTGKFQYNEILEATNDFGERIGKGGFGSVFKGRLPDGRHVAAKRLEAASQGETQFVAEIATIGNTHHYNLVQLVGYCQHQSERILVYDYMENGSLDKHIFYNDNPGFLFLSWKQRFEIALGTARGIAYLHDGCQKHIIHCDVKPENVLLDKNFTPKVSDFGLAKLLDKEQSQILTQIRGTRGYVAPEWFFGNTAITDKIDVYSFGMMLFEIISGRKNTDMAAASSMMYFPEWAYSQVKYEKFMELVDKRVVGDADIEQVLRIACTALWCIQEEASARPRMSKVVKYLEGEIEIPEPPLPFNPFRSRTDQ